MTVRLNNAGATAARNLIGQGKVDRTSAWSFDGADGDALLGSGGDNWSAYSKAHLGVDDAEADQTKARWKYPVIKGGKVYRAGVIAAKSRAAGQGAAEIADEAAKLLDMIDKDKDKKAAAEDGRERRFGSIGLREYDPSLDAAGDEFQRAKIGGYAARFNSPTTISGYFREQIAPGAFSDAIKNCDVRALFNHDENYVLGRNLSRTLRLSEDDAGLSWEVDPPATTWANDLKVSILRGDISQCSFQFQPVVQEWDYSGDMPLRTLRQVRLFDVSAVTFPAYDDTSVALRTLAEARAIPPLSEADQARIARKRGLLDRLTIRAA